jgi:ATP-binding cassette subfamily C (CFTR/MRP) protein 1
MPGLAVLLASFSLVRGCISASEATHRTLLNQCLRYPMNFFDTTPTGRLINRFSKDIDVLDAHLPRNIQWWLRCATAVLAMLFVISMSTPIFLFPATVVGVLYFFVQVRTIAIGSRLRNQAGCLLLVNFA